MDKDALKYAFSSLAWLVLSMAEILVGLYSIVFLIKIIVTLFTDENVLSWVVVVMTLLFLAGTYVTLKYIDYKTMKDCGFTDEEIKRGSF